MVYWLLMSLIGKLVKEKKLLATQKMQVILSLVFHILAFGFGS
jgi:hypothetical protein